MCAKNGRVAMEKIALESHSFHDVFLVRIVAVMLIHYGLCYPWLHLSCFRNQPSLLHVFVLNVACWGCGFFSWPAPLSNCGVEAS